MLVFVAVRSVILAAIIAAVLAWVTSIGFWPVFVLAALVFFVRGGVQWLKAVRDLRSYMAQRIAQWDDDDGESDGRGTREPRHPIDPRPTLRGSADPDESTGPSAIP
jgi:hypothetical protein